MVAFLANYISLPKIFASLISFFLIPTCDKNIVSFSTIDSRLPENMNWSSISFAKELINLKEGKVVVSGGVKPISSEDWPGFDPNFPWSKNVDRNLLFNKSFFIRSPDKKVDCLNDCFSVQEYKGFTWIDLAKTKCVSFVPSRTDLLKPAKGHLVIKTIFKCHAIYFEDFFYQLTDNKGNYYAMHAFEKNGPKTDVVLPKGWFVKKVLINKPLIIAPFGGGDFCYHNIVGDNLGQGYHQYKFAKDSYP